MPTLTKIIQDTKQEGLKVAVWGEPASRKVHAVLPEFEAGTGLRTGCYELFIPFDWNDPIEVGAIAVILLFSEFQPHMHDRQNLVLTEPLYVCRDGHFQPL